MEQIHLSTDKTPRLAPYVHPSSSYGRERVNSRHGLGDLQLAHGEVGAQGEMETGAPGESSTVKTGLVHLSVRVSWRRTQLSHIEDSRLMIHVSNEILLESSQVYSVLLFFQTIPKVFLSFHWLLEMSTEYKVILSNSAQEKPVLYKRHVWKPMCAQGGSAVLSSLGGESKER
jgi:hypothetical protein